MIVVPRQTTPIDAPDAERLLERAYTGMFGRVISARALASLMSLIWIETNRGKSVQNHNFGNISASEKFTGMVWRPTWFELSESSSERDRNLHEAMLRNQAPSAFRAYGTDEDGMLDFVTRLRVNFTEVLSAAELGDPESFRIALSKKYSPDYANPKVTASFAALFKEFGIDPKAVAGVAPSSPPGSVSLPTLRRGLYGPAVRLLRALLGDPGELYDSETVSGVKTFQKSNGLAADGICGPRTWAALIARARPVGLLGSVIG